MNRYFTIGILCGQLAISTYIFKSIFNIWVHWVELLLGISCLFLFFVLRLKKISESYTYLSSRISLTFKIIVFGVVLTSSSIIIADGLNADKIEWSAIIFPLLIVSMTYFQFGRLCEVYYSEDYVFIDFVLRGWKIHWVDISSIEKSRFGYRLFLKDGKWSFFQKSFEESPFGNDESERIEHFVTKLKSKRKTS